MQPETEFWLKFQAGLSIEYTKKLQNFIDETIESYTGEYLPPFIWFPESDIRLAKLRDEYVFSQLRQKINKTNVYLKYFFK